MHTDDPKSTALLAHIIAQTQSNIDFLVSQNYLRASDAATILSKLADVSSTTSSDYAHTGDEEETRNPVLSVAERMRHLNVNIPTFNGNNGNGNSNATTPERVPSPPKAVMAATRRVVPVPPRAPSPRISKVKALWDYNADGSDPNDLSFRQGDLIDLINETNADWWMGRIDGRQGLFPSNYVEKLPSSSPVPSYSSSAPLRSPSPGRIPAPEPMGVMFGQPPSFPSSGSALSPYNTGPPAPPVWQTQPQPYGYGNEKQHQVYAPPPGPVPQQQMQLQAPPPAPEPEKKKSKFGGLGTTMANSAAGGVGFGAGAAIGGGIINSIF